MPIVEKALVQNVLLHGNGKQFIIVYVIVGLLLL